MSSSPKKPVSTSLANFDSLPDTANVRQPIVEALFACSRSTVWRCIKQGILPRPVKYSPRVNCWNVGELRLALSRKG